MLGLTLHWLLLPLMVAQPSDLSPTRAAIPHDDSGIGVNCLCVHLSGNSLSDRHSFAESATKIAHSINSQQ